MKSGPSEEFTDFDNLTADEDFHSKEPDDGAVEDEGLEIETDENLFDTDGDVDEESIQGDASEERTRETEAEYSDENDGDQQRESWLRKNRGLLIFVGVGITVLSIGFAAILPSPKQERSPQPSFSDLEVKGSDSPTRQSNAELSADKRTGSNSADTARETTQTPSTTTIVEGMTEEEVLTFLEPMRDKINELSVVLSDQNEYLNSLSVSQSAENQQLTKENLEVIKAAIVAGLDESEEYLEEKIGHLQAQVKSLESELATLKKTKSAEPRRPLTMVTAVEGKAKVVVDGTDDEQVIWNGSVLRGYGRVERVGPWGCLYLESGEKYEPTNASCKEIN